MNDGDKVLTYEDAKQLCMKAFDGGATYGSESMRYGVNARAYDWEHWLKENERLFRPKPTVEDVLRECCYKYHSLLVDDMNDAINGVERDYIAPDEIIAEFAAKLRLAGDAE